MPAPLEWQVRRRIFARAQQGRSAADIAHELELSPRTVRHLCQRIRDVGKVALEPSYHRPVATLTPLIKLALQLREQHPTWGATYILLHKCTNDIRT